MSSDILPAIKEKSSSNEKQADYMATTHGTIWIFEKPGILFKFKLNIFRSKILRATIEFKPDGILLHRVDITKKNK